MTRANRLILTLLTLLTLFGCTNLPSTRVESVGWQQHQQQLQTIREYQASGKLGYISPQQRQSLNFYWQKNADHSQLRLSTFLGQTVLNLSISPHGAQVKTYDDQIIDAQNADALVYELTGLSIPIEQLQDWLLGLPTEADGFQLNQNNLLASLDKQLGLSRWHLEYLNYQAYPFVSTSASSTSVPLPAKLKLTQDQISLNLVISKWTLMP